MGFGSASAIGKVIKKPLAPGATSPDAATAGTPPTPDAVLAASQAAIAAGAASQRQRRRASSSGEATLPTPGASTPPVSGVARSLRRF